MIHLAAALLLALAQELNDETYDTLKAAISEAPGLPDGIVLKSIVGLTLWTLAPLAGAIAWFNRQDLSKE